MAEASKVAENHMKVEASVKPIRLQHQFHKTIGCAEKKYGLALKLYQDYVGKSSSKQYATKDGRMVKIEIMQNLSWGHQEQLEKSRIQIMFPEHLNKC